MWRIDSSHTCFVSPSLLLLIAISLSLLTGCASSSLPPRLKPKEAELISALPLSASVGVMSYKHPAYSDKLTSALQSAGIFSQVLPISDFTSPPDYVAVVEAQVHGSAVLPVATLATLGVVPTVVSEDHGLSFSLAPYSQRSRKVLIDASYRGATTLGWAAMAVNVSPNFTYSDPDKSERFQRMLAYRTLIALLPGTETRER